MWKARAARWEESQPSNTRLGACSSFIVGVLSAPATSVATIPMDDDHVSQQDTGYAIANPGSTPINIKLIFVHPDGTIHLTLNPPALNPLAPGGHICHVPLAGRERPVLSVPRHGGHD